MITDLPEQLIAQAEFLLRNAVVNEANVRRAVSSAYYALYHLLVRDAVVNWRHADQHARLARFFDHKRMKDGSAAILKEIESARATQPPAETTNRHFASGYRPWPKPLPICSRRGTRPITTLECRSDPSMQRWMSRRRVGVTAWAEVRDEPLAQRYLYSLLFKDRS